MPKISVIMPVYNTKEEYLREAIQSILNQTFSDFEVIVVDDASTVDVRDIVNSYLDERIHYYRLAKNEGAAGARNYAIAKSVGEYIAFMDSDDVSYANRFEIQKNYLEAHPDIGCLGSRMDIIGDDKDNISFVEIFSHDEIESFLLFENCAFCQSTVMLRKEILDKHNIRYKKQYVPSEDYALWLDLIGQTKFAILPDKLLSYRFHNEGISHRQKELQEKSSNLAQSRAIERYCGLDKFDRDLFTKLYMNQSLSKDDITMLNSQLTPIIKTIKDKKYIKYFQFYKNLFKKQYCKIHTISGQLALFKSPLNTEFNFSLPFRLFYLITRGIF